MKNLSKILIALATVAGTSGAISSAHAATSTATYNLGTMGPGDGQFLTENVPTGDFINYFPFVVATDPAVQGSVFNSPSTLANVQVLNIDDLFLSLDTTGPGGVVLASAPGGETLDYADLIPGTAYEFVVTGDADGHGFHNTAGQYNLAFNVSAVPLPAALPLFGLTLLGLGGVGWKRRRQGQIASGASAA